VASMHTMEGAREVSIINYPELHRFHVSVDLLSTSGMKLNYITALTVNTKTQPSFHHHALLIHLHTALHTILPD